MNASLIERWNNVISETDVVWVLGDVGLGDIRESLRCVEKLKGVKHLVVGNHDRMFKERDRSVWEQAYRDAGFASIHHGQHFFEDGETELLLCHFPYRGDSGATDRFTEMRAVDEGLPLLHGHTHGRWRKNGRMIDVGVDAWGGTPVALDVILDLFETGDEQLEASPWL